MPNLAGGSRNSDMPPKRVPQSYAWWRWDACGASLCQDIFLLLFDRSWFCGNLVLMSCLVTERFASPSVSFPRRIYFPSLETCRYSLNELLTVFPPLCQQKEVNRVWGLICWWPRTFLLLLLRWPLNSFFLKLQLSILKRQRGHGPIFSNRISKFFLFREHRWVICFLFSCGRTHFINTKRELRFLQFHCCEQFESCPQPAFPVGGWRAPLPSGLRAAMSRCWRY